MPRYLVNRTPQPNGDHEVHVDTCYWLSLAQSTADLGYHATCVTAVSAARAIYPTANGCKHCASSCHTS